MFLNFCKAWFHQRDIHHKGMHLLHMDLLEEIVDYNADYIVSLTQGEENHSRNYS
jgi:hypothetical protein